MSSLTLDVGPAARRGPQGALRTGGILLAAALGLAACDSSSSDNGGGGGTPQGIDTLGTDFTRAFNLGPNDQPLDSSTLSLVATPLIEPFDP